MRPGSPAPTPPPRPTDWLDAQPALDLLTGKWTLPILEALHDGTHRHRDLSHRLGARISNKMLTETLRRLEHHQLITRHTGREGQTTGYDLAPLGRSLYPLITALSHWSRQHRGQLPPPAPTPAPAPAPRDNHDTTHG